VISQVPKIFDGPALPADPAVLAELETQVADADLAARPVVLPDFHHKSDMELPSSVAVAFARLGLPWDDALVVSMHGSGDGRDLRRAANICRAHPKVAVLTGPGANAGALARELIGKTAAGGGSGWGGTDGSGWSGAGDGDIGGGEGDTGGGGVSGGWAGGGGQGGAGDSDIWGGAGVGEGAALAAPERTLVVAARLGERGESVERLTLRQAALALGYISESRFDELMQPGRMTRRADVGSARGQEPRTK